MTASSPAISEHLRNELKSRDHRRRAAACLELGRLLEEGRTAAIEPLVDRLGDEHPDVRLHAADALSSGAVEAVEGRLLDALEASPAGVRPGHRASIIRALGLLERRCGGRLCAALQAELANPEPDVRFQAVVAKNHLACTAEAFRRAVPSLLRDPDDEVAAVAATAAAELELSEALPALLERWRTSRGFAGRHLALAAAHLGSDEVVPTLEVAIRRGIDAIDAIDALVMLGTERAVEKLEWAARSFRVHPVLRARAGVALAELDAKAAPDAIQKALASRRTELRCGTIEWLGRKRLGKYVGRLIDILADPTHRDSAVAAYSLGFSDAPEAERALRAAAASDPRAEVREEAAAALESAEGEIDD